MLRLQRCLSSIVSNCYPRALIEIIVVDNDSTDGSAKAARDYGAIVIRASDTSMAALRNRGARAALGGILAFADSDHEIDRNWIETAVGVLAAPDVAATGAAPLTQPSPNWVQQQYDGLRSRPAACEDVTWLGSGNLAVKRAVFERVGGFDASLTACEDVDLCNRIGQAGFRIVADPRLRSTHFGDPQTLRALFFGELGARPRQLARDLQRPAEPAPLPACAGAGRRVVVPEGRGRRVGLRSGDRGRSVPDRRADTVGNQGGGNRQAAIAARSDRRIAGAGRRGGVRSGAGAGARYPR